MDDIQYIGEHLLPRALGEVATVISFAGVFFAVIAYFLALRNNSDRTYIKAGRSFFAVHTFGALSLIGLMFYVMLNRYYEYAYAFEHVSDDLPFHYMFSAFWEGQQGSFCLWMFWHLILGWILIRKAKEWEPGVLLVLCTIELWLSSMLLGVYIPFTDFKLGDNPMLLLREVVDIPLFANEDYLSLIDGKGLNLLLQNYWNVIHPPITFLGFASVSIPFCYALAGIFTKRYTEWFKPALPWVLFSVGILGVGILMGSAWAYEALTFGGYWAWDPVENMSLVPWIMLLAGMHAHLITQATGHSRRSVYLFYLLAFCLSIYSTYLVRSGALEDTSVHAFTEMGMGPQLTAFLAFFVLGSAFVLAKHWNKIPTPAKEESSYSREFWMFIGLMILAISSILITYSTSLPVINKIVQLFDPEYEGQVIKDANEHYNKYQLWIAAFIAILTGIAQWTRFAPKSKPGKQLMMHIAVHTLLAGASTAAIATGLNNPTWPILILLFSALYGIFANMDYLISRLKGNWKLWGSTLSHVGFGVMLLGIIISGINKRYISQNPTLMAGIFSGLEEEMMMRNVVLLKNEPIYSQGYMLEYERDTFLGTERQYIISFKPVDESGEPTDSFYLSPNVIYSKNFDNIEVYHPAIKHAIHEDVFTRIATLPKAEVDPKFAQALEDTLVYVKYPVQIGDTIQLDNHEILIHGIERNPVAKNIPLQELDKLVGVRMTVLNKNTSAIYPITPKAILRGNLSYVLPEKINAEELRIKISDTVLLPYLPLQQQEFIDAYKLKVGMSLKLENHNLRFLSFDRNPDHPFYYEEANDIAIGAKLLIESNEGSSDTLSPVYVIRDSKIIPISDFDVNSGIQVDFLRLDPTTETITINVTQRSPEFNIYVAKNVSRTDFLVLEALAFPGINLFWFGSILMLGGVFFSWVQRRKQKTNFIS